MATTAEEVNSEGGHLTVTTAGVATTTLTTTHSTPLTTTSTTNGIGLAQAGPSRAGSDPPLAEQIADLNFYLRRVTLGGNGDISQIESYGGGPDHEMFLDAVLSVGMHYGWTEGQLVRTVEMKLKDKAREYYGALLPGERPKTMAEMRIWFRRVFERKLTINAGKRELERCIRNPGEPLGEYAQRLKVVANKMFPVNSLTSGDKLYHRNLLLVNQFIEGLEGRLANEVLRAGEFYNLDDCLAVAERCEDIVSRMILETRYDIRMSTIRRIEAEDAEGNHGRNTYQPRGQEGFGGSHRRNGYHEGQQEGTGSELVPYATGEAQRERGTTSANMPYGGRNEPARTGRRINGRRHPRQGNSRFEPNHDPNRWQLRRVNHTQSFRIPFTVKYPYMKNRCTRCGEEGHFSNPCTNPKRIFCYHCGKLGEICSLNSQRAAIQPPR